MRKFLYLLFIIWVVNGYAQNDSVRFTLDVDRFAGNIQALQEVHINYYSNRPVSKIIMPEWGDSIEVIDTEPHRTSSSQLQIINGEQKNIRQEGFYYKVRFLYPGMVTVPGTTATIGGKQYTCPSQTIEVFPGKEISHVTCTLSVSPEHPQPGKEFWFTITCNSKPDEEYPSISHMGLLQVSRKMEKSSTNGVEQYKFAYKYRSNKSGTYSLYPENLTFGGVTYPVEVYCFDIGHGNKNISLYLWGLLIVFAVASLFIYRQDHRPVAAGTVSSRFCFKAYMILLLTMVFLLFAFLLLSNILADTSILLGLFMLIVVICLVFGEMRRSITKIEINGNNISVSNYFGFGKKKTYNLSEMEGFTRSVLQSRGGNYQYTYLIKNNRRIIRVSEFYHKNYQSLLSCIYKRCKFLGDKQVSLIRETKEIFAPIQ